MKALTTFLNSWSPWRLRKRIGELESSLEHLTECRDDFVDTLHQSVLQDKQRLETENGLLVTARNNLQAELDNLRKRIAVRVKYLNELIAEWETEEGTK